MMTIVLADVVEVVQESVAEILAEMIHDGPVLDVGMIDGMIIIDDELRHLIDMIETIDDLAIVLTTVHLHRQLSMTTDRRTPPAPALASTKVRLAIAVEVVVVETVHETDPKVKVHHEVIEHPYQTPAASMNPTATSNEVDNDYAPLNPDDMTTAILQVHTPHEVPLIDVMTNLDDEHLV